MCGNCCEGRCSKGSCVFSAILKILVIVGGINWGLVGIGMLLGKGASFNVVNLLLGSLPLIEGIVYLLVGVAAVLMIFTCKCKKCAGTCTPEEKKEEVAGVGNL
jgi:uncharacterized membrane protein YuzA (DUF378 family)